MKKYQVTFVKRFVMTFDEESIQAVALRAKDLALQQPPGTCDVVSIYAEDYVAPPDDPKPWVPPRGRPNGGGTPGTPVIRREILVDQIAKVA